MPNLGFIIDNRRCIGCHACTVACKSEHDVPVGVNRTWVKYIEKGEFPKSTRLFSVMRCNHCDDAPCVNICPTQALHRLDNGIVDFDNRRCIGCKACMQACPYDALYIDPNTHTAAKCNYCAHRIEKQLEPACVNVCPTQAIVSGDLDDPESRISQLRSREKVTVRKPEKGTSPALFYIDGDQTSLDPSATGPLGGSLWGGEQSTGVGHYAKFVEHRVASESSNKSGESPRVIDSLEKLLSLGEAGDGVLVPDKNDAQQISQAENVKTELTRRVYDSPRKGDLWGWQVTSYVWTKAIAAGGIVLPAFAKLTGLADVSEFTIWLGIVLACVFMALTGMLLTADLDQPKRFLYVLLRPQWKSWLVKGAYVISVFGALIVAWMIARLFLNSIANQIIGWLLIPAGAMTAIYTAFLFAQAKGRDFWQSPLLPVHMLIHSIMAGASALAVFAPFSNESWSRFVALTLAISIGIKILIDWFELSITHPTKDSKTVATMIWRGRYAKLYWLGVILVGCLVPLGFASTGQPALLPIAGISCLVGLYIAEHIWVRAPQKIALS